MAESTEDARLFPKVTKLRGMHALVLAGFAILLTLTATTLQAQNTNIEPDSKGSNSASTSRTISVTGFNVNNNPNRLLVANIAISDCRWAVSQVTYSSLAGFQRKLEAPGTGCSQTSGGAPALETWTYLAPPVRPPGNTTVTATLVCKVGYSCDTVSFSGTGLNDMQGGGTYTGTTAATFTIEIDATGTPDTFRWRKDAGSWTSGVLIDLTNQDLSDGITATFGAETGHTVGDTWTISADPANRPDLVMGVQGLFNVNQTDPGLTGGTNAGNSSSPTQSISEYDRYVYVHGVASQGTGGAVTLDSILPATHQWTANTGSGASDVYGTGGINAGSSPFYLYIDSIASSTKWVTTLLEVKPADATAVTGTTFEAIAQRLGEGVSTGNGTTLRWRTGSEVANLGFNLFREDNGVRTQVNPDLIAGSALFVGPRTTLAQGKGYQWTDPNPPTPSTRYWLEALDLSGKKQTFGPVYPSSVRPARNAGEEDSFEEAVMLSDFALCSEGSGTESRIPGISADGANLDGSVRPERFASPIESDAAPLVTQREIAAGQAAKISVDREGWYKVALQQLPLGASASPSTRYLQLFADGVEQPINIAGDSRTGYSVEFYGRPLESEYAKSRVYWLIVGKVPGLRFASQGPTEASLVQPSNFPFTVERKDRVLYFAALTSNGDESNFFGPVVSPTPITQSLTLGKLDTTAGGDWPLRVTLQGVTGAAHSVEVRLNGNLAGYVNFGNQTKGSATLMVPRAWLQEGSNSVVLTAKAGAEDYSLVDSIRITYPHRYELENGVLKFEAAAGTQLELAGAAKGVPRILDITDPGAITELRVAAASGVARAVVPGAAGQRTLLAFSTNLLAPLSVKANTPSSWSADKTKSDLTIVTNSAFASAAAALKNRRQSEGLLVKVVDVEDLYDEYSYGAKNPASIRSFLAGNAPRYVALMGDSTFDPRNYLGFGDFDFVPSKSIPTEYFKTASDDWFVDFGATGIPQIPIGRFAVRSASEATTAVNKVIAADQARLSGASWLTKVLHVADQDDPFMAPYSFEGEVSGLSAVVPSNYTKSQILVGQTGVPAARASILSAFNEGALLYTFMGHGSQDRWSKSNVLDLSSAAGLNGSSRVPVLLALDCLNGLFIDVYGESLAERLQRQAGGPAAVWASTGLTSPYGQVDMAKAFYQQIFRKTGIRLGDAARAAKLTVTDPDVRKTWTLFGDPSMIVR